MSSRVASKKLKVGTRHATVRTRSRKFTPISEEQRWKSAIHESGHVFLSLWHGLPLRSVSIQKDFRTPLSRTVSRRRTITDYEAGKTLLKSGWPESYRLARKTGHGNDADVLVANIEHNLAGPASEQVFFNGKRSGGESDWADARETLAKWKSSRDGTASKFGRKPLLSVIWHRVLSIVRKYRGVIEAIATELMKRGKPDGHEVKAIARHALKGEGRSQS